MSFYDVETPLRRRSLLDFGRTTKVRLFLSEDAPYQSGLNTQDHLQAKTAWLLHAGGLNEPDDSLPPGFEAPYRNHPIIDISQIPVIKWQHPHKFVLNQEWRVVAGEESQECSIENTRQQGALEAIYPRPTSIPPNPLISPDVQATHTMDDNHIPLIPITAPEDEDTAEQHQDQSNTLSPTNHHAPPHNHNYPTVQTVNSYKPELNYASTNFPSHNIPRLGAEPDVTAAASVALTAIVKSSEEGSLIDRDLLVKLLSDPSMMNKLLSSNHHSSYIPPQTLNHSNIHCPPPHPPPPPPPSFLPNLHFGASSERATAIATTNQVKDVNYYKSLIQMHGREQQQESSSVVAGNMNQQRVVDFKAKVQKPCTYFNTPRGCRNGASCLFLHDASLNVDQQTGPSKRVKLDGGITGRN